MRPPRERGIAAQTVGEARRSCHRNPEVGYICLIKDPDGNNVEFPVEQVPG